MKVVKREFPTREEWLEWRKGGVGSSEIAAIMGVSPYKKPFDIFRDKTSQHVSAEKNTFITDRGNELEPIARQKFQSWYNIDMGVDDTFEPCNLEIEGTIYRASLDGLSEDGKTFIEIKYQGDEAHGKGLIAQHYWLQMQWQFMVSKAVQAYFVSINKDKQIRMIKVYPVTESEFEEMIQAAKDFWKQVTEQKFATEKSDMQQYFDEYQRLGNEIKRLTEEQDEVKKLIFNTDVTHCGQFEVITVERVGSVDYSKIEALKGLDLTPYRKASSNYKQIKFKA